MLESIINLALDICQRKMELYFQENPFSEVSEILLSWPAVSYYALKLSQSASYCSIQAKHVTQLIRTSPGPGCSN